MDRLKSRLSGGELLIYRILWLYAGISPLIAFRVSDNFAIGAVDFLLIPALFALFFVSGNPVTRITLPYILFIFFSIISFTISAAINDFSMGDLSIVRIISIFAPFLLVTKIRNFGKTEYCTLARTFLISGGASILLGIAFFHMGIELRTDQQRIWSGDGTGSSVRAGGILGNSSNFGHFTSIWGTVSLVSIVLCSPKYAKTLSIFVFSVALYSTFISSSRAALLHLILGWVIMIPIIFRIREMVYFFCAATAAIVLLVVLSEGEMSGTIATNIRRLDILNITGESQFLRTIRYDNWNYLLQIWQNHPIIGTGYKNIEVVYGVYSDNAFLGIFIELGLFAGVAFIFFWINITAKMAYLAFKGSSWGIGALAIIISEISHAFTLDTYTLWYSMPLAMLFTAAIARVASNDFASSNA